MNWLKRWFKRPPTPKEEIPTVEELKRQGREEAQYTYEMLRGMTSEEMAEYNRRQRQFLKENGYLPGWPNDPFRNLWG